MRSKSLAVALTTAVLLAACGGGGDDTPAPAPAPTPSPSPSPSPGPAPAPTDRAASATELTAAKDEIAKTAAILSNEALRVIEVAQFFGNGATGTCASLSASTGVGNYTVTFKNAAGADVATGRPVADNDLVSINFDNCRIDTDNTAPTGPVVPDTQGATRNGLVRLLVESAAERRGTLTTFGFSIKETPSSTVTTSITDKAPADGAAFKVDLSNAGDRDVGYTGTVTPAVSTDPWLFKITDTAATEKVFEVSSYSVLVGLKKAVNQDDNVTPDLDPAVATVASGTFKKTDPALTPAPTTITGSLN